MALEEPVAWYRVDVRRQHSRLAVKCPRTLDENMCHLSDPAVSRAEITDLTERQGRYVLEHCVCALGGAPWGCVWVGEAA